MRQVDNECCLASRIQVLEAGFQRLIEDSKTAQQPSCRAIREKVLGLAEEFKAAEKESRSQFERLLSARRLAEHERLRYQELFENSPDGYLITSMTGNIGEINRSAAELLESDQTYFIGKRIARFIDHGQKRDLMFRLTGLRQADGPQEWECRMRGCKGRVFHAGMRVALLNPDGASKPVIRWLIRDISSRKNVEDQLRHMSNQLLLVQEEERKRLSMELHDSIGQYLTAAKFSVENVLARMSEKLEPCDRNSLQAVIPILQNSINEVRRLYTDLRPPLLDEMGVLMTIQWYLRQFGNIYPSIRFDKEIELQEDEISDILKVVIFRVTQEALHNIVKHSKADRVVLRLVAREAGIELSIEDNGSGILQGDKAQGDFYRRGLGLISMRERTELSGGKFSIRSAPGQGTHIGAIWPFRPPVPGHPR